MLHGHSEHSQFVKLTRYGVTGGDHGRQFVNEVVHFVPSSFLNLAVWFPVETAVNLVPCS